MNKPAIIRIKRNPHFMGIMRPFKIFIDSKKVAEIKNGQEVLLEVEAGRHIVDITGSLWAKSEQLTIDAEGNSQTNLECGVANKYMYGLFALVFISVLTRTLVHGTVVARPIGLAISVAVTVYSLVMLFYTSRRGTVYYLKNSLPSAGGQ